ncbi:MAG: hypothetical protein KDB90_12450 [Planctomycetes bacterium]|nr:hypothetical protein [Planctomycetota bacterium]
MRRVPALAGWALVLLVAACGGGESANTAGKFNGPPGGTAVSAKPPDDPAPYPIEVVANAACALDGSIYVTGGWGNRDSEGNGSFVDLAFRYDPKANEWSSLPPMPRARCFHACVASGGKVWLFGGVTRIEDQVGDVTVAEVDCFDPKTGQWTTPTKMPTPRNRLAGAAVNDRVILVGGMAANKDSDVVEEFTPATGGWSTGGPLPRACHGMALAAVNDTLVAVGGSQHMIGTWLYDPKSRQWREGAELPGPVLFAAAAGYEDQVYLFGNRSSGDIPLLRYDIAGNAWEQAAQKSVETHRTAAVALNGYIYVIGGEDPTGGELSRVSRYDLATGNWAHSH